MNINQKNNKLPLSYYPHNDVVFLAQDLLGKIIFTRIDNQITSGIIVETEAYKSTNDMASHAYMNKRTNRNEMMYSGGGVTYIYICYGIHHMLNIVTNKKNVPDAILIRAIEPLDGIKIMQSRIPSNHTNKMTNGPGKLSKALGINMDFNGSKLNNNKIWIENNPNTSKIQIIRKERVGIHCAGEDSKLPWRFYINKNKYISKI